MTLNDKSTLDKLLLLLSMFELGHANVRTTKALLRQITLRLPPDKIRGKFKESEIERSWKQLDAQGLVVKPPYQGWQVNENIDEIQLLSLFADQEIDLLVAIYDYLYEELRGYYWVYDEASQARSMRHYFKLSLVLDDEEGYQMVMNWVARLPGHARRLGELDKIATDLLLASLSIPALLGPQLTAVVLNDQLIRGAQEVKALSPELESLAVRVIQKKYPHQEYLMASCAYYFLLRGDFSQLAALLSHRKHYFALLAMGALKLTEGAFAEAQQNFDQGLQGYEVEIANDSRTPRLPVSSLLFFTLLQAATEKFYDDQLLEQAQKVFKRTPTSLFPQGHQLIDALRKLAKKQVGASTIRQLGTPTLGLETLFTCYIVTWSDAHLSAVFLAQLRKTYERAKANGYQWLAWEAANLLSQTNSASIDQQTLLQLKPSTPVRSLRSLIPKVESWERVALGIEKFFDKHATAPVNQRQERLIVLFDTKGDEMIVEFKIQKIAKRGGWTSGRRGGYSEMLNFSRSQATPDESRILDLLFHSRLGGRAKLYYDGMYYDEQQLLERLVGFPRVFHHANPKVRLDIRKEQPKGFMEENDQGEITLQVNFLPRNDNDFGLYKTGPTEFTLVPFTEQQRDFLALFTKEKVVFPPTAGTRVLDFVDQIKSVLPVETILEEDLSDFPHFAGSPIPCLHLLPVGDLFRLEVFMKPYPAGTQYFKPGSGRQVYKVTIEETIHLVERDQAQELAAARQLEAALQLPPSARHADWQWELQTTEDCLEVLNRIHPLRSKDQVTLEWPKGEKFKLLGSLQLSDLALRISKGKDYWFEMDGELKVSESLVFSFRQLLDLTADAKKGFVEISEGQFMAITDRLQQQLELTRSLLNKGAGQKMKFPKLAGPALEDMLAEVGQLETDQEWKAQQARIAKAKTIRPRKPKGFKTELRTYQKTGFRWMMQLAEWGVGGCLADDMGLGKTIQALAVLLARAEQGPAMVVAPASVCRNWLRETEKFTPGLRPLLFGMGDRQEMLAQLKAGDLLIVSYGLMQSAIEALQDIPFNMLILDEAQAIKNTTTKRFKAALQLQATFRMALSGTPVENHLGELWSLFTFINPGLLGNKKSFADRYGRPIQRGEQAAVEQLKKLVQPFILRRRKSEVLQELPPKTEIIQTITLPEDERAFYEAARRQTLDKLSKELDQQQAGTQHLMVLAEITRLRRACCHPRLLDAQSAFPGAKLEAFKEIIHDLREGGHRVLVFSQFVDYLKIVEDWVKKEKIPYQYLDGSTPGKKREQAVKAFQQGDGDLFLISLKAGGTGLNLTAANYVVILDPWWNPAVEDQAADRAHRIGQQQAVTVYRFVTEGTIEEKIVQLHQEKRHLADTLLQGADAAAKITTKDLLNILQEDSG
jgi:superfamily II DNA or RNA helicase